MPTGDWPGAERELEKALRVGRSAERALYGEALARLAELRLAQGRLEEAERLIEGFEDHFTSAWVLAALRLARSEPGAAASILQRRLCEVQEHERERPGSYRAGAAPRLEEAALLELLSESEIARGDREAAFVHARRLEELGGVAGCESILACAERALGRALGARRDAEAARRHLERALSLFGRLAMPFEVARTRLLLTCAGIPRQAQGSGVIGVELLGGCRVGRVRGWWCGCCARGRPALLRSATLGLAPGPAT